MPDDGFAQPFDPFAGRIRAYSAYVEALGDARLKDAQAQLAEAQAAGELARADLLAILCAQLAHDLAGLDAARHEVAHRERAIARRAWYAARILSGKPLADYAGVEDAYRGFETEAKAAGVPDLWEPLAVTVRGDDFFRNGYPLSRASDPPAEATRNGLALVDWMFAGRLVPRSGSAADEAVSATFRAVASVARADVAALESVLEQIRAGTYAVWNPIPLITGITPHPAQQALLARALPAEMVG